MLHAFKHLFKDLEFYSKIFCFILPYHVTWVSQSIFPVRNSIYDDVFEEHFFLNRCA